MNDQATAEYLLAEDRRQKKALHEFSVEQNLRRQVTEALAYANGYVDFLRELGGGRSRIEGQPIAEVVSDLLGYNDTLSLLMNILAKSTDPLVDALRANIAQRVVDERAKDIAEVGDE